MRNVLLLSAGVVLVMFALSGYVWTQIPAGEQVCVHWNALGECDRYGSKFAGIMLMPIVATALAGLLALIPQIDPRAAHIAQSRRAYAVVWGATLVFTLVLHGALMIELLGHDARLSTYLPLLVGLLFIAIGSVMGQVRSNYFFGIRTPWTLSSELSWRKTHQLGGKLFILEGLLIAAAAVVLPN